MEFLYPAEYDVALSADDDRVPENNHGLGAVRARGAEAVLVLIGVIDAGRLMADGLLSGPTTGLALRGPTEGGEGFIDACAAWKDLRQLQPPWGEDIWKTRPGEEPVAFDLESLDCGQVDVPATWMFPPGRQASRLEHLIVAGGHLRTAEDRTCLAALRGLDTLTIQGMDLPLDGEKIPWPHFDCRRLVVTNLSEGNADFLSENSWSAGLEALELESVDRIPHEMYESLGRAKTLRSLRIQSSAAAASDVEALFSSDSLEVIEIERRRKYPKPEVIAPQVGWGHATSPSGASVWARPQR